MLISSPHSPRLLYVLTSVAAKYALRIVRGVADDPDVGVLVKRKSDFDPHNAWSVTSVVLIPVLVLASGLFAGLTLGYMSLDETQLKVLSMSGTPKQREYAQKIYPIRKNGHLLLVTLLLSNMIVNESLPVIADPVLGGGVQSVVVSTVLIVIFAEIIPQSLFTRHGLYLGAKLAGLTKFLIYFMGIIAWPVAKLLEFVLGPHHGIIYRRAELKELIAMHSNAQRHGGDLKHDTVTIIGATLDLQEKVVRQAMTPIDEVFMLSIDSRLDYDLLRKIWKTGHSRVPVYEEVEVPLATREGQEEPLPPSLAVNAKPTMHRVKKIVGILLVKQCVLLDPKDATPLRKIPLNKVPFVPNNEPLLGILDKFQEGRSHMAIVSRFSVEKAASVKKAVKRGLTQRLRERVGMGDTDSSDSSDSDAEEGKSSGSEKDKKKDDDSTLDGNGAPKKGWGRPGRRRRQRSTDVEMGIKEGSEEDETDGKEGVKKGSEKAKSKSRRGSLNVRVGGQLQSMPADAVLGKEGAAEFLQSFDPAVMPLGIITLEDVLEELIGEEIYDEFDQEGAHGDPYVHPPRHVPAAPVVGEAPSGTSTEASAAPMTKASAPAALKPMSLKGFNFLRSRSAPPTPRDAEAEKPGNVTPVYGNHENVEKPDRDVDAGPIIEMPMPQRGPPSVILERTITSSPSPLAGTIPLPAEDTALNAPPAAPPSINPKSKSLPSGDASSGGGGLTVPSALPAGLAASAAVPRSASPAPSLEARLLERKRRLVGAVSSNPSSTVSLAIPVPASGGGGAKSAGAPKGKSFKSSPLVSERTGAAVVPDKVEETGADAGAGGDGQGEKNGDERISDEKDKEGPDK